MDLLFTIAGIRSTDAQGITFYKNYVPTPSGLTIIVSRNLNGTTPFSTTAYALSDHLGSSDALVDGTAGKVGNLLVQENFAPFGLRRGSNWTGAPSAPDWAAIAKTTRRGFTFHEMLDNIGLVHMNGRVYDPNVGRFMSTDSLIGDLSDSQSVNPYAYVGNRPLSAVDPSGEDAGLPEVLVQAAADAGGPTNPVGVVLTAIDIVYNILDIRGGSAC